MCVCQSVCPQGGLQVTIAHDALNLPCPLGHQTWDPLPKAWPQPLPNIRPKTPPTGSGRLLLTFGGKYWSPVQTCSLEDSPGTTSGDKTEDLFRLVHLRTPHPRIIWWQPLKHVRFPHLKRIEFEFTDFDTKG